MTPPVDFYFDFISPYGYLASKKIEALAAGHARRVRWRPFLMGVPIIKVMGLKPLMQTPLKSTYTHRDVFRLAEWLATPINPPSEKATNSRAATRAFYWLEERDPRGAVEFARWVLDAMWVRGADISAPATLLEAAPFLGVSSDDLSAAMESPAMKEKVREVVEAAMSRGVFGSPYVIADDEPFWGVDRLPMLDHWLGAKSWAPAAQTQDDPC